VRSVEEIAFRLKQEAANLRLWVAPPRPNLNANSPLAGFPDPQRVTSELKSSVFAVDVERIASEILRHEFPLLGLTVKTGPEIDWRRDYIHGKTTDARYFRLIPYLNFDQAGDHKIVWELNRHQHLVVLAQAYLFTGRQEFLDEIASELESWSAANPFQCGINWTSALEVAFRALSWIWIWHLVGDRLRPELQSRLLTGLYQHGEHLNHNLSVYFSPNTHLLGEAVALHAIGRLFPLFPNAGGWQTKGHETVLAQMKAQVQTDGSHFEQSAYYHVYALDMFLFHAVVAETPEWYRDKLIHMAGFLDTLLGPGRRLPLFGDDDGGRFFHPYGARDCFGRATLATAAVVLGRAWAFTATDLDEQARWWVDGNAKPVTSQDRASKLYENAGLAVMESGGVQVIVDAGPFGPGSAGHSHSDTLSIIARKLDEDVLIDPGTYLYVGDAAQRNWFRGSAAHNTIRIDGLDQAVPSGPFRWTGKPEVQIREWNNNDDRALLDATCSYRVFTHRRVVMFRKPGVLFVFDEITGPTGEHLLEQFWHLGDPQWREHLLIADLGSSVEVLEGGEHGWRSPALRAKVPATALRVSRRRSLPARFGTVLFFEEPQARAVKLKGCGAGWEFTFPGSTAKSCTLDVTRP
jgi:hypothetical protein